MQGQVDHIVNTYTGLVSAGKEKFQADLFVIAQAKVNGYTVVTEETGSAASEKIPGVCEAMKVECINLMQLIDEEDWVLGLTGAHGCFGCCVTPLYWSKQTKNDCQR